MDYDRKSFGEADTVLSPINMEAIVDIQNVFVLRRGCPYW
jgi:hypothetical protein